MLVQLLNIPKSDREWEIWSWHHRLSHDAVRQAVQTQKNTELTDYQVDPITMSDLPGWLQRNAQLHIEMDAAVGSQASDLQDVDLTDDRQRQAWVYLHFLEHQTAELRLGIGS